MKSAKDRKGKETARKGNQGRREGTAVLQQRSRGRRAREDDDMTTGEVGTDDASVTFHAKETRMPLNESRQKDGRS